MTISSPSRAMSWPAGTGVQRLCQHRSGPPAQTARRPPHHLIGLIANACIEATGRFGMELGYYVTLVKDATAAFGQDAMRAAHAINGPTYAHAILTTEALLAQLSA